MEEIREHYPVCSLLILSLTVVTGQRAKMINIDMAVWTQRQWGLWRTELMFLEELRTVCVPKVYIFTLGDEFYGNSR